MHHKMHEKCAVQSSKRKKLGLEWETDYQQNWRMFEIRFILCVAKAVLLHHRSIISEKKYIYKNSSFRFCSHNFVQIVSRSTTYREYRVLFPFALSLSCCWLSSIFNTHSIHHRWIINFFFVCFLQHIIEKLLPEWRVKKWRKTWKPESHPELRTYESPARWLDETRTLCSFADSFHSTILLQIVSN